MMPPFGNDPGVDFVTDLISPRFGDSGLGASRRLKPGQRQALKEVMEQIESGTWTFEAVPCPCGGRRFRVVCLQDRFGIPCPVSSCRQCGLLLANPRLTEKAYGEFYRSYYRRLYMGWSPGMLFNDQRMRGWNLLQWLRNQGESLGTGDLVLEIGAGAGGILSAFRDSGCRVAGCDFDAAFLAHGRQQGVELFEGGSSTLPYKGQARLVLMNHVFEHTFRPLEELATIQELLRKDGRLFIEVPGIRGEICQYKRGGHFLYDFRDFTSNAHTYHFDQPDLIRVAGLGGFAAVKCDEQIRGIFHPAPVVAPWSTAVVSDAADPSLAQVERLRAYEARRKAIKWFYRPAYWGHVAAHESLRATLKGLRLLSLVKKLKACLTRGPAR